MDQLPLPDMPVPPPAALRRPAGVRLAKHRGAHRVCDECVRLIHALGMERAPYPAPARWRAVLEDFDGYLCYAHMQELTDR
jgi:hypothetical protein